MKNPMLIAVFGIVAAAGVVSGCNNSSSGAVTKDEAKQFRAPLGQPMPAEARAAMEKMNRNASAAQSQGSAKP